MDHVLDNSIWRALNTGNSHLSYGNLQAKYLKRDVGLFAGLKHNSRSHLYELHTLLPVESVVVLFCNNDLDLTPGWQVDVKKPLLQMVYRPTFALPVENTAITSLHDNDIPAMMELIELTKPGPFLHRTIEFGNYEGIFLDNKLISMAGQRLKPLPYIEISAVCTHPDYAGRGLAAQLIKSQVAKIIANGFIPFLHVEPHKTTARSLYEKLGFENRKQVQVYVLRKSLV